MYALKNAKDVSALKAVSQNLMHQNLTITDGIYGILSETDVKEQIMGLGKQNVPGGVGGMEELLTINKEILIRQKQK